MFYSSLAGTTVTSRPFLNHQLISSCQTGSNGSNTTVRAHSLFTRAVNNVSPTSVSCRVWEVGGSTVLRLLTASSTNGGRGRLFRHSPMPLHLTPQRTPSLAASSTHCCKTLATSICRQTITRRTSIELTLAELGVQFTVQHIRYLKFKHLDSQKGIISHSKPGRSRAVLSDYNWTS